MRTLKMNQYGIVLTGREYGVNAANEIFSTLPIPTVFDFTGVAALGSSFGDEIFKKVLESGVKSVQIVGASHVVKECLKQIQADFEIDFIYK